MLLSGRVVKWPVKTVTRKNAQRSQTKISKALRPAAGALQPSAPRSKSSAAENVLATMQSQRTADHQASSNHIESLWKTWILIQLYQHVPTHYFCSNSGHLAAPPPPPAAAALAPAANNTSKQESTQTQARTYINHQTPTSALSLTSVSSAYPLSALSIPNRSHCRWPVKACAKHATQHKTWHWIEICFWGRALENTVKISKIDSVLFLERKAGKMFASGALHARGTFSTLHRENAAWFWWLFCAMCLRLNASSRHTCIRAGMAACHSDSSFGILAKPNTWMSHYPRRNKHQLAFEATSTALRDTSRI